MHCSGQSEYISSQNNTYGPLMGTIFVVALCVVLGYLNRSHPVILGRMSRKHPRKRYMGPMWAQCGLFWVTMNIHVVCKLNQKIFEKFIVLWY